MRSKTPNSLWCTVVRILWSILKGNCKKIQVINSFLRVSSFAVRFPLFGFWLFTGLTNASHQPFHEMFWFIFFLNLRLSENFITSASGDTIGNLHLTSHQVITSSVSQLLLQLTFFFLSVIVTKMVEETFWPLYYENQRAFPNRISILYSSWTSHIKSACLSQGTHSLLRNKSNCRALALYVEFFWKVIDTSSFLTVFYNFWPFKAILFTLSCGLQSSLTCSFCRQ